MNSPQLPDLDDACGKRFVYRDFVECCDSWRSLRVDNTPVQIETYAALHNLAVIVLDPVSEQFGSISLTYGVATPQMSKAIKRDISPRVDQHASYEQSSSGKAICDRGGAACDFLVNGVDSLSIAQWVVTHTNFDRLYYYGKDRPLHVSAADDAKGQCVIVKRDEVSRRVLPSVISIEKFLALQE